MARPVVKRSKKHPARQQVHEPESLERVARAFLEVSPSDVLFNLDHWKRRFTAALNKHKDWRREALEGRDQIAELNRYHDTLKGDTDEDGLPGNTDRSVEPGEGEPGAG